VGGAKLSVCFASAISTSYTLVSEDFSFSIAILFSFATWTARSSYLIIDARNNISWVRERESIQVVNNNYQKNKQHSVLEVKEEKKKGWGKV
jgi:hypothetical protein